MKRSWTTLALILGLVGLLIVLGTLQYRWLVQVSEADGDKAKKQVKVQAESFATDFNREIQNAYFNFQTEPVTWKERDWTAFNERYDFWREKTSYPDLVRGFYFITRDSGELLRYDADKRAFVPAAFDADIETLRSRLADEKNFTPVQQDLLTLVMPIHEPGKKIEQILIRRTSDGIPPPEMTMPPVYGYLVIRLDPETVRQRMIPDLTTKYFGDGEFRVGVDDRDGTPVIAAVSTESADATAKLLDLSPDNFLFFANKELMSSLGEKREGVVLNSRVESRSFTNRSDADDNPKTFKIEVQNGGKPRTQVFATSAPDSKAPWMLAVQHTSGSIDAAAAATLRRNLATGFGLLLLLAGAVATIIVSAMRAKRFAQRQIDFVSSVSHEFRTPLAVIYSAGENLADGVAKEDAQVSRYGELIKGEGRKLSGMVEQILGFAGANSGKRKYRFAETSVSDVVNDAVEECRPLIGEKSVDVELRISDKLPEISADKAALSQAVQNLILNSIKYSNGSSWLRLTAENGGGNVRITVEDHGLGISKADLKQIFDPFYRSKSVVDAQIHGNGLGLSLVKQIVAAHKGKIDVESELGKGSVFTIELPCNRF
jgi:signal transduction histidine kinase